MVKLPGDKQKLLDKILNEIKLIDGVEAVVLGGSYALNMADDESDLDIGIYYSETSPFDIGKIKRLAEKYAQNEKPTVTGFYEWGPWVNGGAWINTANGKVDLLYKNIDQVRTTIGNAHKGIWENHFEQQPPYGFSSVIFLAETHYCIPLYDPNSDIEKLKESVKKYPLKLKQTVLNDSLWSAEFTIWQAEKFAAKNDVYNTIGCIVRAVKNIVTALFSINEIYPMGDKRAIDILERATIKPDNLNHKINAILCCEQDNMIHNVLLLKTIFNEIVAVTKGAYNPFYKL
ncbi:MAG: nucleotidyltransferase domain-containing protein [Parafilimonas sp.]